MTVGQIAGLIAAIAFVVLVIFLGMALVQTVKVLQELQKTVAESTELLKVSTDKAEKIMEESSELVSKTNELMDDVNYKASKLNPLFDTVENIGTKTANATSNNPEESNAFGISNMLKMAKIATSTAKIFSRRGRK
ncbi:DUF948 domain-containing protein [Lactobacillus terrae]|uniref:DUF948 domain-containing protein n=1 Tax=Lactobacillus terrae TaxID=2269374 RepID=UPI000C1B6552|nr:DUF948 domain-containing protein [Lactobacillus terrae]